MPDTFLSLQFQAKNLIWGPTKLAAVALLHASICNYLCAAETLHHPVCTYPPSLGLSP